MSLGPLCVLHGEVSVQVLCPLFNWIVCLPGVELYELFIYLGDQALVQYIIDIYIFSYSWFLLHFADVFLSHEVDFYFDEIPFVFSFLYIPCFRGQTLQFKYCLQEY